MNILCVQHLLNEAYYQNYTDNNVHQRTFKIKAEHRNKNNK